MASTAVKQFKAMFPTSATPSKLSPAKFPVPLQLFNKWGTETLDDLTDLIGTFGIHVHLTDGKQGCIAVIWLCSASDVNRQTKAIQYANKHQKEKLKLHQSGKIMLCVLRQILLPACSTCFIYFSAIYHVNNVVIIQYHNNNNHYYFIFPLKRKADCVFVCVAWVSLTSNKHIKKNQEM